MGLDMLEVIMEVEDQFGVQIPDTDYAKLRTVGDLHDLIVLKKTGFRPGRCLSPMFFCRLRRQLMEQFSARRDQVRLDAGLEMFLPREDRRAHWAALQDRMGFHLPPLRLSRGQMRGLTAIALSIPLTAALLAAPLGITVAVLALMLGAIAAYILAVLATGWIDTWAVELPSECATVRGTVATLRDWNFVRTPDMDPYLAEGLDWNRLREIVSEALGVPPDQVTPDARFIEDLHAD